jgi:opacity protein-like surface antigen
MRHRVRALVVLALVVAASPVRAQNPGLPVYNIGVPRGIGLYGDVGFPNDAAGGGTVFGVTGRAGLGPFGVTATLSSYDSDAPGAGEASVGGTLNYKLLGGPLVPLSATLQAGVSYVKAGFEGAFIPEDPVLPSVHAYHFPIGIGFALVIPNPVLSIHPWLAPRVDIARLSSESDSETNTNFGLSGGIEFNLLNGFGVQAAYDRVFSGKRDDLSTFGIGVHYAFRVPGL